MEKKCNGKVKRNCNNLKNSKCKYRNLKSSKEKEQRSNGLKEKKDCELNCNNSIG